MSKAQVEQKMPLVHPMISKKAKNTDSIEAMTPDADKRVRGQFVNIETPGQTFTVTARFYKGMELFKKVFNDQEECEIPLSVARWINERCYTEEHSYLTDDKGHPLKTGKKKPRAKFVIEAYV